jgi:hypothetical protein
MVVSSIERDLEVSGQIAGLVDRAFEASGLALNPP